MHLKALISLCLIGQAVAQATTENQPSGSQTLPPSPSGSICHPHGDHWHCDSPSTTAVDNHSATGSCEPHGDHWHCPSGVPKPTTPPAQTKSSASATATGGHDHDGHDGHDHGSGKECTPHGDHWHCPSGVPKPTTPPAQTKSSVSATATGGHDHDGHDGHDHGSSKECTPHGDHWHCPSGVSKPTYPPTAAPTKPASGTNSGTAASTTATAGAGRNNVVFGAASLAGAVLVAAIMA